MTDIMRKLTSRRARRGATALEYALVLAFVAVAVLAALLSLNTSLTTTIKGIGTKVTTAGNSSFK